jgi:hypothetical protein
MDNRQIYRKAVGRTTPTQEQDNPHKGLVAQAKLEWREHPETKRLIEFLHKSRNGLLEQAVVQNSNGVDEKILNKILAKAKAVGEVIDYVTGNE